MYLLRDKKTGGNYGEKDIEEKRENVRVREEKWKEGREGGKEGERKERNKGTI